LTVFGASASISAKAIAGGNVNYAFQATDAQSGTSIFVKQAPEFVAIFGPGGFPLTSARMQQEIDVYNEWRAILGDESQKRFLPEIYLFDNVNMVFVMEFFGSCDLMEHGLLSTGMVSPAVSRGLGEFMGRTHAATHSTVVPSDRASYLHHHFENRAMRDVQLEFVFTKCYKETTDEQRAGLVVDADFMAEIEALKAAYSGEVADSRVLCHGDLHPGSIMVNQEDGTVKIIDPEFTVYGPPGLDLGSLLSGFVLAAVHHAFSGAETSAAAVRSLRAGAAGIWGAYTDSMGAGGIAPATVAKIGAEAVGFTVAEVCRTALGFAGGRKWLQFGDEATKAAAVKCAMGIVQRCMTGRHQGGMEVLFMELDALASP
jgi:5-methylthioribose kinase